MIGMMEWIAELIGRLPAWLRILIVIAAYLVARVVFGGIAGFALVAGILLGIVAVLGVLRKAGRLDSLPGPLERLLDRVTGSRAPLPARTAAPPAAPQAQPPAGRPSLSRKQAYDAATSAIARLHGIETAKARLDQLIDLASTAAKRGQTGFGTAAPASLIVMSGPHGTGKSTVAKQFARLLYGLGVTHVPDAVELDGPYVLAQGLGGAGQLAMEAARAALDGVLLFDNAEWIGSSSGRAWNGVGVEVGRALMRVASLDENRGRLFIIATGGPGLSASLFDDAELKRTWLNRLTIHRIAFDELTDEQLLAVFRDLQAQKSVSLDDNLEPQVMRLLLERKRRAGEHFDNALAVLQLFDELYSSAAPRAAHAATPSIRLTRDDIVAASL